MICTTLSGHLAIKHPTLGVLCREDGFVFLKNQGNHKDYSWKDGHKSSCGYKYVRINGKDYSVHRLIAEAFIPNYEQKPTVDHINRIKEDNRVGNLRWASHKEQNENTASVINRLPFLNRCCENRKLYNAELRKHCLSYRKEDGSYSMTGYLTEEIYNKMKSMSMTDRYHYYKNLKI